MGQKISSFLTKTIKIGTKLLPVWAVVFIISVAAAVTMFPVISNIYEGSVNDIRSASLEITDINIPEPLYVEYPFNVTVAVNNPQDFGVNSVFQMELKLMFNTSPPPPVDEPVTLIDQNFSSSSQIQAEVNNSYYLVTIILPNINGTEQLKIPSGSHTYHIQLKLHVKPVWIDYKAFFMEGPDL